MIPLIAVAALILVDNATKRRTNLLITRLLCAVIPALQLIAPIILYSHIVSLTSEKSTDLSLGVFAWALAVIYLALRLMFSKLNFLQLQEKPLSLCAFGLRYNIFTLLTYLAGFIGIILLLLFSDVFLSAMAAVIALLSLVLAPLGLVLLALVAFEVMGSFVVLIMIGIVWVFVLMVPVVLGIRAVRAAAAQRIVSVKENVVFIVFMCFPLANTITLLIFRHLIGKRLRSSSEN